MKQLQEELTGEYLHKMFTKIKSRTHMSGANYFRDREVFKKLAEDINKMLVKE